MEFFEHSGQLGVGSTSGVLERVEAALGRYRGIRFVRSGDEINFRVPWHMHAGPLFHAGSGRLWANENGGQLHYSLSYRKSAIVVAVAVAVVCLVLPELASEDVPAGARVVFACVGWLWVWGSWRLIMPNRFQAFLRSELQTPRNRLG